MSPSGTGSGARNRAQEGTARARPDLLARARRVRGTGRRAVLGLAGAPGAGKSTLAAALARATGGVVVPLDGFHLADAELSALGRRERKGAQDTFDATGYLALLRRLRTDPEPVLAPAFDRAGEVVVPGAISVAPGALVITEGNYLLLDTPPWAAVRAELDEAWFVETGDALRIERLVARFVRYGWAEDVARERVERGSDAANARLVAPTAARADLIVRP